jgi:hypothetical protein
MIFNADSFFLSFLMRAVPSTQFELSLGFDFPLPLVASQDARKRR